MRGQVVLVEKLGKRISGVDLSNGQPTSAPEDVKLVKISDRSKAIKTVLVSGDSKLRPDTRPGAHTRQSPSSGRLS